MNEEIKDLLDVSHDTIVQLIEKIQDLEKGPAQHGVVFRAKFVLEEINDELKK
jgi:hypothetical protein